MRSRVALVVVCGLALLAGCSGLPFADGGGDSGDGVLDAETVAREHRSALEEAGTFTQVRRSSIDESGSDRGNRRREVVRVDLNRDRYLRVRESPAGTTSRLYVEGDRGLRRSGDSGLRVDPENNASYYTVAGQLKSLVEEANFTRVGQRTVEGTETVLYRSSDTEGLVRALGGLDEPGVTVESAVIRLYRAENGLVKRVAWRTVISREDRTLVSTENVTFRRLGTTTVRRPAWAEDGQGSVVGDARPRVGTRVGARPPA